MKKKLKKFYDWLKAVFLAFLDSMVLRSIPCANHTQKVLIVRLDAIGDFVLWLDAAKALVNHYRAQGDFVVLLGNKVWASWAQEMELADEVWGIDICRFESNLLYRWRWLSRLRKAGFGIAIQPTFSRLFLLGDSLIRASNASERIGSGGDESNISSFFKSWSNRWYTHLIPATSSSLMEIKRNSEFMRGLGITDFPARLPTIPCHSSGDGVGLPQRSYAVIFPAASWRGKEWPIERFAEIGRRLVDLGLHVVVAGGPADCVRASQLLEAMPGKVTDLAGKTTLRELADLLRNASIVVTNDTSAVHIGAAVNVPTVCILGGGHFGRFVPYEIDVTEKNRKTPVIVASRMPCFGCNWLCIYPRDKGAPVKCIQDISAEKVWDAMEQALKESQLFVEGKFV